MHLYLSDYKNIFYRQHGDDRQFGVMADEAEKIIPEAVSTNADRFMQVDYAMLDIERTVH